MDRDDDELDRWADEQAAKAASATAEEEALFKYVEGEPYPFANSWLFRLVRRIRARVTGRPVSPGGWIS